MKRKKNKSRKTFHQCMTTPSFNWSLFLQYMTTPSFNWSSFHQCMTTPSFNWSSPNLFNEFVDLADANYGFNIFKAGRWITPFQYFSGRQLDNSFPVETKIMVYKHIIFLRVCYLISSHIGIGHRPAFVISHLIYLRTSCRWGTVV